MDADKEWTQTQLEIAEWELTEAKANLTWISKEKEWLNKDSTEAQNQLEQEWDELLQKLDDAKVLVQTLQEGLKKSETALTESKNETELLLKTKNKLSKELEI